jgi:hypothetical protein
MKLKQLITISAAFAALSAICILPASAQLVTNGSFETGDFTGWNLGGNTGFTGVANNFSGVNPEDGNYLGYFGAVGSDTNLTQDIATTAGTTYDVSFWYYSFGGSPSDLSSTFNGVTGFSVTNPAPTSSWTYESYDVTATSSSTTLEFDVRNDPSYNLLDNVSVAAAPEASTAVGLGLMLAGILAVGVASRRKTVNVN